MTTLFNEPDYMQTPANAKIQKLYKLPALLKKGCKFVCLKEEKVKDDCISKIPCCPHTKRHARINNPRTWVPFNIALDYYRASSSTANPYLTIAIALDNSSINDSGDKLIGLDLDDCRDPESGDLEYWAMEYFGRLDCYWEISPSGTGLRGFCLGNLPADSIRHDNIEIYKNKRFLSLTGNRIPGTPKYVPDCRSEILAIYKELSRNRSQPPRRQRPALQPLIGLSDDEIIAKCHKGRSREKFRLLWVGDFTNYDSQSEGDLALCSILSHVVGPNLHRINSLFRQSGLFRKKWDKRWSGSTYGVRTIERAISNNNLRRRR